MVHTHNGIAFTFKKEGNSDIAVTQMNLNDILSELSQEKKDKYCMIPLI
jgi:hypothetical protein